MKYNLIKGKVTINTPLDSKNLYSITNGDLFATLQKLFLIEKKEFVWCRLFCLYGEKEDKWRLLAYIHKQLKKRLTVKLKSDYQTRNFINVFDTVEIISKVFLDKNIGLVNIFQKNLFQLRNFLKPLQGSMED